MSQSPLPEADARLKALVRERIEDWRRRLIDLSWRNPLINFKPRPTSSLTIATPSLHVLLADPDREEPFDFYLPPEADDKGDTAAAPTRPPLPDELVTTAESRSRIEQTLDTLARRSNAEFEDKALRILHLAVGFLDWEDAGRGEALRSPLILVPVELKRDSPRDPYRLYFVPDEEMVINPALTIKLETDAGLDLAEDWAWEDKPVAEELADIRRALAGRSWTIAEDVVLGLFSFQKLVMYRDLLLNEDQIAAHPTIRALATGSSPAGAAARFGSVPDLDKLDNAQATKGLFSILDADASQRRCIEVAKHGCSLVMHGPPGTGKSQTIANVIAEAIGQQKRILFISEKAAALDVVHKRLAERGLADLCLKLHGRDAARREVVESLYESLSTRTRPRPGFTDHDFDRLEASRAKLNETVLQLHAPAPELIGQSPREVYARLARIYDAPYADGAPPASNRVDGAAAEELERLLGWFRTAGEHWRVATDEQFAWRGAALTAYEDALRARLLGDLDDIRACEAELRARAEDTGRPLGLPAPASASAARELASFGELLTGAPALDASWLEPGAATHLEATLEDAEAAHALLHEVLTSYSALFPARPLSSRPPDIAERTQAVVSELEALAGPRAGWAGRLVDRLPELLDSVRDLPAAIERLGEHARAVANLLGQPLSAITLAAVGRLCSLGELAYGLTDRPDQRWLVPAGLKRAQDEFANSRAGLEEHRDAREQLLAVYEPAIFDLDLDALLIRLAAGAEKRFPKLNGQYRADCKAIKALRRDGRAPDDPVAAIEEASRVKRLGERIGRAAERLASAFGDWYKGPDTDTVALERALAAARSVIELAAPDSDLSALAGQVALGAEPDTTFGQALTLARSTLTEIEARLPALDAPFGESRIAGLVALPVDQLAASVIALQGPLETLRSLTDELRHGRLEPTDDLDRLLVDAEVISVAHAQAARIAEREERWRATLGERYRGDDTDWAALEASSAWLHEFSDRSAGPLPRPLREKLLAVERAWPDFAGLATATEHYLAAAATIAEVFEPDHRAELQAVAHAQASEELIERIDALAVDIDRLPGWCDYAAARNRIHDAGWQTFLASLAARSVPAEQVVSAFERAWWHQRLELVHDRLPSLRDFRGHDHGRLIDEFRELDRRCIATAVDRILTANNAGRSTPVALEGSEVGLLKREHGKKRRHMPVRKLLARLPVLLPELKPCLMMSPLTVSHYLSPEHHFDLVIFDEASQVPPWDAINCVYRGAQLVIAGDNKQLPPTAFFRLADLEANTYDEDSDATEELMESILDAAEAILPAETLRWHYRSRHEHLIAFSNHHIYNNKLVTFPAPVLESPTLGVHLIYVPDGIYDRGRSGTNRVEARRVAEWVIEHLQATPERSVGVVAFSVSQADAITDALDLKRAEHPELEHHFDGDRLDAIFVKNLESVQGDERDVMVFSVGYGRDQHGTFTHNFGPLTKDGGHRRLNVAITRARDQVDVITSVRAADFNLSELASPGAKLLREYLAFAERGPDALSEEIESLGGDFESPFEESVADAIRALGYHPIPQIGVGGFRIDLGVVNPTVPGEFALGIECDGATYHSTPTARDRDRLRQQVLEDLGWRIARIWSRDWVRDRPAELARLKTAIETAIREGRPTRHRDTPRTSETRAERHRDTIEVHEIDSPEAAAELPWVTTYRRCELTPLPRNIEFHDPANRRNLVPHLAALVDREAPIAVGYAIQRLAEAAQIARRGSRVMDAGRRAISEAARQGLVEQRGDYLWIPGRALQAVRTPDSADHRTRREIDEIPPEEIDLALQRLREASGTVEDDRLISQTARVLGFDRAGGRIQAAIAERLKDALPTKQTQPVRIEACPHCGQRNRVIPGFVRCGRCKLTFEVAPTPAYASATSLPRHDS